MPFRGGCRFDNKIAKRQPPFSCVMLCKYTINCMKMAAELDLCNKLQEAFNSLTVYQIV